MRSAENCYPSLLTVGIKVSIAKCQLENFGLKSATLTFKMEFLVVAIVKFSEVQL